MKFVATPLPGVLLVEAERFTDERGFFARTWSVDELRQQGLDSALSQCSISFNERAGTLRGMHWQAAPYAETKLVRCTMGAVFDVALDLRRDSPTYRQWFAAELSAHNRQALYIPHGVAHGFQTLVDGTELLYQISSPHEPAAARGLRWDDPAFGIDWPACAARILSPRDAACPDYE